MTSPPTATTRLVVDTDVASYIFSERARQTVLDRLLALNHQRYAEREAAAERPPRPNPLASRPRRPNWIRTIQPGSVGPPRPIGPISGSDADVLGKTVSLRREQP